MIPIIYIKVKVIGSPKREYHLLGNVKKQRMMPRLVHRWRSLDALLIDEIATCWFESIYCYTNTIIRSILGARYFIIFYFFLFFWFIVTCSPFYHPQIFTSGPTSPYLCHASDESLAWRNRIGRDKSVLAASIIPLFSFSVSTCDIVHFQEAWHLSSSWQD